MSELYLMTTITDRERAETFRRLYERHGVGVHYVTLGAGTAVSEMLDAFGLEKTEKAILFSVVTGESWKKIRRGLRVGMRIDVPGTGVAFLVPLSSIGGKKPLRFLTAGQNFEKGEESTLKDTRYELLVAITNQGYTNSVMEAARAQGAGGGTVVHAKGTGMDKAEQFLGVSLVDEKEMVLIVVRSAQKDPVMRAIMDHAGLNSKAGTILFSLPVTDTAGMRLMEADAAEEAEND